MLERLIIAGFGGQGVMLTGKLIATLAAGRHEHVTYFPSYGAEVRGGTAHCHVIVSDEEIASPIVEQADTLIVMNQPSVERFWPRLVDEGLGLVNSSLASGDERPGAVEIPATETADRLGDVRTANMVMLGAYLHRKGMFGLADAQQAVAEALAKAGPEVLSINRQALNNGYGL